MSNKKLLQKKIIILAESAKHHNYCVGGIEFDTGNWIRLVSDDEDSVGALTDYDLTYEDGSRCQIFDIVNVVLIGPKPTPEQPENFLIDRNYQFKKEGESTLEDILKIHPAEKRKKIFGTREEKVRDEYLEKYHVDYSLTLIKADNLEFKWVERKTTGESKLKVAFDFNGERYIKMSVTDLNFLKEVKTGAKFNTAYLLLSIGAPVESGEHFKFVAQIFKDPKDANYD